MNKELKDITITVYATQDTVESDSFNNTYDANATYPVVNITELKEALTNGGVVAVTEDIQTNNIEDTAALIPVLRRLWHQRPEGRCCDHQRRLLLRRRYGCAGSGGYPHYQRRYLRLRAVQQPDLRLQLLDQLRGQRLQEWYGEGRHSGWYVFINFDPSNNSAEGAGTNFVADGYKVVPQTQTNGDIWYTAVAE